MESETYRKEVAARIRDRIFRLRQKGHATSKGEPMSFAAIARTLDPPVTRVTVSLVADGKTVSERIRRAIERELGECYWVRRKEKA